MSEHRLVRLKPGGPVKRYDYRLGDRYLTFAKPGVWAKVPLAVAEKLAKKLSNPNNQYSPPIFDVCTEDEARRIDSVAAAEREAKRAVEEPSVDTAVDMTGTDEGRGDLDLDDLPQRQKALDAFDAMASGEAEPEDDEELEEPEEPAPKPRRRRAAAAKRKPAAKKKKKKTVRASAKPKAKKTAAKSAAAKPRKKSSRGAASRRKRK